MQDTPWSLPAGTTTAHTASKIYSVRVPAAAASVLDELVWRMNTFDQLIEGRELKPEAVIALLVDSTIKILAEPDSWEAQQMRAHLIDQGLLDP